MTSVGAASTAFDNNGNTLQDGTGNHYVYDAWNRLVATKNSGGTTLATYRYDGNGRLSLTMNAGSIDSEYYYNANGQIIAEADGGTHTTADYVWSADGYPPFKLSTWCFDLAPPGSEPPDPSQHNF